MSAELFLELYLTGKKIRSIVRHQNQDKMLTNVILLILLKETHTITSLAKRLSLALSTTSEKLQHLFSQKLIVFQKGKDKRNNLISLTPKGQKLAHNIYTRLSHFTLLCTQNYSQETLNVFIDFLKNLQTNITKGHWYAEKNYS